MLPTTDSLSLIQAVLRECAADHDAFAAALRRRAIPHLSYSQIAAVEFCPTRYHLQYICQREPAVQSPALNRGKQFHRLLALAYAHNTSTLVDSAHLPGPLRNALALAEQHRWPGARVVGVEHCFVLPPPAPGMPPVVGVIDLLLEHEGELLVIDHKTGRDFTPQDALQMAIYRAYVHQQWGAAHPVRFFYDQYRWVERLDRVRKPAFQRVEVTAGLPAWPAALARIGSGWQVIQRLRAGARPARGGPCFRCLYRGCC